MKTKKHELIAFDACQHGLDRFIEQTNNTEADVDVASLVGGKNTYSDILWLLNGKGVSTDRIVRFSCDCALINIDLIKPYTDKHDLIVEFLKNRVGNNARAADSAAYAADSAAYAADSAADSADSAARAAAYAADSAAYAAAAARAADSAAYAAARAAAYAAAAARASDDKVNQLLTDLINEF